MVGCRLMSRIVMKSEPSEDGPILVIEEAFSGVMLRQSDGNEIGVCYRDDTFEINIRPKVSLPEDANWWRVNMQLGTIERLEPPGAAREGVPHNSMTMEGRDDASGPVVEPKEARHTSPCAPCASCDRPATRTDEDGYRRCDDCGPKEAGS